MSDENVNLVRGAYENFNGGNVPGVIERLDANVQWTEPGGGKSPAGTFNGPDAVASDVFAPIPENFDEFVCTPEDFKDEGDEVIVTGRFKGTSKSGAQLDAGFEHNFEVSDGKIARFQNKPEAEAWASAWS